MVPLFPHFQTCFSFPYHFMLTHPLSSVGSLTFSSGHKLQQNSDTNTYLLEFKLTFKLLPLQLLTVHTHTRILVQQLQLKFQFSHPLLFK